MSKEYIYSGECEPTICPCGAIHPWTYELSKCSCGAEGCYECQAECEFCDKTFCAGEVKKIDGWKLCAGCRATKEIVDGVPLAAQCLDLAA